jgi:membrane associated rhomboid family serine protease
MGIYDRDYYRREGPSFLDAFALRGQICKLLIVANAVCFVLQFLGRQGTTDAFTDALILVPERVMSGEVWRLLTYAFLHDTSTWTHIVFNMWFLWIFGGPVEEVLGRWEFLAFYLVSALLGGMAYTLQAELGWQIGPNFPCLGASGAVTAVTVMCALHYPSMTILLMFVLPVPIWGLVVFQVLQDSFGLLGGVGRVAYSVHLAGAAFAGLYYKLHWRLIGFLPRFGSWSVPRSRPRLRVFSEPDDAREPVAVAGPPLGDVDEQLEAKVDAVLAKVARSGQSSLSDTEKQILLRASEIYKKRRS